MRSIFTLAGILVAAGVAMWAFSKTSIPAAQQGQEARKDAEQISGRDTDGTPAGDTMTLEAHSTNGKFDSLLVTDVVAGGAMQRYYGLQRDDQITQIGEVGVKDNNDPDLAIALAKQAYQEKKPLVVLRNGQSVTLAGNPTRAIPGLPQ
jgi:S1-C subfamily serine protease